MKNDAKSFYILLKVENVEDECLNFKLIRSKSEMTKWAPKDIFVKTSLSFRSADKKYFANDRLSWVSLYIKTVEIQSDFINLIEKVIVFLYKLYL